jgi:hypothetical protein
VAAAAGEQQGAAGCEVTAKPDGCQLGDEHGGVAVHAAVGADSKSEFAFNDFAASELLLVPTTSHGLRVGKEFGSE